MDDEILCYIPQLGEYFLSGMKANVSMKARLHFFALVRKLSSIPDIAVESRFASFAASATVALLREGETIVDRRLNGKLTKLAVRQKEWIASIENTLASVTAAVLEEELKRRAFALRADLTSIVANCDGAWPMDHHNELA